MVVTHSLYLTVDPAVKIGTQYTSARKDSLIKTENISIFIKALCYTQGYQQGKVKISV